MATSKAVSLVVRHTLADDRHKWSEEEGEEKSAGREVELRSAG